MLAVFSGGYGQMLPGSNGMPMIAPLLLEDHRFSSLLTVVNMASVAESAEVVLLDTDGIRVAKRTIFLTPHSQTAVSIREMLDAA